MNWFRENNIFDDRRMQKSVGGKTALPSKLKPQQQQQNKNEQAYADIIKVVKRGKNNLNKISACFVPPEYGFQFDDVSHRGLDYNVERDLREHFLSDNEREAMKSLLRFATNYMLGYINSKDMLTFGRSAGSMKVKDKLEHVQESECTMCGYKFKDNTRVWLLYVIVRRSKDDNVPITFEFACCECHDNYRDSLNSYQIYPHIESVHVRKLFEAGFFYQYIFPLNFKNTQLTLKNIEITKHDGPFKIIQELLRKHKRPNDHIIYITLRTMNGIVLKEINHNVQLSRYRNIFKKPTVSDDINCFIVNDPSALMEAITNKSFDSIHGTLFAEIHLLEIEEFVTGVITFPVKPSKNNSCSACKRTKKFYNNPVINCSRCGFTNRYNFKGDYDYIYFNPKAVQTHETNGEIVRYYDLKLHDIICKQNLKDDY